MIRVKTYALIAAAMLLLPALGTSQQRPTSEEAARMLRSNPALLEQLRQRILSSGLTPEQVRARLRAEGYPEDLLDAYLGTSDGATGNAAPSDDVFDAVGALGLADSLDMVLMRCGIIDRDVGDRRDSIDATGRVIPRGAGDTLDDRREAERRRAALRAACQARLDSLQSGTLKSRLDADSGFNIFGLETFRQPTNLFDANLTGPVDANYQLSPGDQLVLILTGDVEQSYQLEVTREGFVVIPQVGQLFVNNLSLAQLEDLLYSRLGRVYSGVRRGPGATTRFYITPSRLSSNQIAVQGDVMRPGMHRISSAGTAMTALYAAGGPTDNGSLRRIQIRRAGRTVAELDVYDYLLRGDASNDVRLRNGDIVFVPIHGPRVRIVGEIARPATYEMNVDEALDDAIAFAGGFKPTAGRARVQIERILPPTERTGGAARVVTEVVSDQFATGTGPAIPVLPGDIIRIFPIAERVRNRVAVRGNVWTPGPQGIEPGQTTIADALRAAGGVKPDTYLGQILVSRMQRDSSRIQMRAALLDTAGAVIGDFPLREDDEITVFSVSEFRHPRYVAISGAVQKGGRFEYREGMTVRDLVLMAGGLKESALLTEAEVARLPHDRTRGQTAITFRVPLDSSYIFSRGPDGRYLGPPGLPAPSGPAAEQPLLPYDNVLILRQPDWELQRNVAIAGEVRYPGKYALQTKSERISDIIKRAGGLTTEGYADGIVFIRRHSPDLETTVQVWNAAGRIGLETAGRPLNTAGRIGIELPRVLRNPRERDNLLLQDGDSIFIPRYSGVIHVTGAVNSPLAVAYVPGRDLAWYVRSAGGPAVRADLGRAYVTQPNGKVEAAVKRRFAPDTQPKPRPGSVVFVPERDPSERDSLTVFTSAFGAIATALGSLIAIIAVLNR